jgi:hypothetical protein
MTVVRINTPKQFKAIAYHNGVNIGVHPDTSWGVVSGVGSMTSSGIFQSDTLGTSIIGGTADLWFIGNISIPQGVHSFRYDTDVTTVPYSAIEYSLGRDFPGGWTTTPLPITQIAKDESITIATPNVFTNSPEIGFSHWNTQPNGFGKNYYAGDLALIPEPMTVYAQSKVVFPVTLTYSRTAGSLAIYASAQIGVVGYITTSLGNFPATGCSFSSTSPNITLGNDLNGNWGADIIITNASAGTYTQTINIQGNITTFDLIVYDPTISGLTSYIAPDISTYVYVFYVLDALDQYGYAFPIPYGSGVSVSAISGELTQDLIASDYYTYRPSNAVSTDTITASYEAFSISDTINIHQDTLSSVLISANTPISIGTTSPVNIWGPSTLYAPYVTIYPQYPPVGDTRVLVLSTTDGTLVRDGDYGLFTAPNTTGVVTITATFGDLVGTFDISVI